MYLSQIYEGEQGLLDAMAQHTPPYVPGRDLSGISRFERWYPSGSGAVGSAHHTEWRWYDTAGEHIGTSFHYGGNDVDCIEADGMFDT